MSDTTESNPGVDASEPVKKRRGNPNFQKGKSNAYYNTKKDETMSDETTNTTSDSANTGEKKHIPQDIFSDEIPNKPILPLEGELKMKDYATINDGGTQQAGNTNYVKSTTTETTQGNPMGAPSPDNMYMNNPPPGVNNGMGMGPQQPLPGEDVKTQAEQMVKLMLRGYEKLHGLGRYMGKMDENELMNLHTTGKINLDFELPLGRKSLKARDFFADYNQGIDENIVVEEKFKDDITPPLTRIAIKRGWVLGDEVFVLGVIAEDLGTKVSLLMGLRKSANLVLDALQQIAKNQAGPKKPTEQQERQPDPESMNPNNNGNWREAPTVEDAHIVP